MRSNLFGTNLESATTDRFTLQNSRMLRVALDGEVMARQGAMVAYQGQVDFAYQGSGGMGKLFKKTFTGEGMSLMKVSGHGDVFFADDAMEIHLVNLENDALTVNGSNVLAFDPTLTWDIKRVEGPSMMAGGVFNTTFTGTGTFSEPLNIRCSNRCAKPVRPFRSFRDPTLYATATDTTGAARSGETITRRPFFKRVSV